MRWMTTGLMIGLVGGTLSSISVAGKLPTGDPVLVGKHTTNVDDLKMRRRFGFGMSAGGPLSVLGLEVDVNLETNFALSAGLGTGIDYSTFMLKARYFLPGEWVSPYFALGVARWWTDHPTDSRISPALLRIKFLGDKTAPNGFDSPILFPAFGVQFMSAAGFAFFAEVQILLQLFDFAYGTFGGAGMHWYF